MSQPARIHMTYAEYLELERSSELRHEFLDGVVWAMSGGTIRHSAVKTNVVAAIHTALAGKPCRPYDSDLKVRVLATGLATYPDLTVICGDPERHPEDPNAATNPTVLVEVLSATTERWDRGEKFANYREIGSLQHYLLVSPDQQHVDHYRRLPDASWRLTDHRAGSTIELDAVDVALAVDLLYANLPEEPEEAAE